MTDEEIQAMMSDPEHKEFHDLATHVGLCKLRHQFTVEKFKGIKFQLYRIEGIAISATATVIVLMGKMLNWW